MTDAEVLERAVQEARNRPHVKNTLTSRDGGVCIRGAVLTAINGFEHHVLTDYLMRSQYRRIDAILEKQLDCNPAIWNNRASTTKDDVVVELERAHQHALTA